MKNSLVLSVCRRRFRPLFMLALFSYCAVIPSAVSPAFGWSSVLETANSPGTHHGLCREAYHMLERDPAFRGIRFPALQDIITQGSVTALYLGRGPGPDDATKSAYSMHYYNPIIKQGNAPKAVLHNYSALKTDLLHAPIRGIDINSARKAAWLGHFIQDMTVPYHILGMPAGYQIHEKNFRSIVGQNRLQTRLTALQSRFETDRKETGQNADWFEAWYYDGRDTAPVKTSTHYAYEFYATSTRPIREFGSLALWHNNQPADVFVRSVATLARQIVDATPDAFVPQSRTTSRLLDIAVQATYNIWRASFSALRVVLLKVTPESGKRDTYTVTVGVQNLIVESAHNVYVDLTIGDTPGSLRTFRTTMLSELRPTGSGTANLSANGVYLPNPDARLIMQVNGSYAKTPDSGHSRNMDHIRNHLTASPQKKCSDYENRVSAACRAHNLQQARTLMAEAEQAGCRIPENIYRACQTPLPGASRQWLVWHKCDEKGGFWCDLFLEETTEAKLRQREKKVTVFGTYQSKTDAIRKTCGGLKKARMGGQFAHGILAEARNGLFAVGAFLKSSGNGFVCRE